MSKDKRVKGCYNLTCKNYRKEVKFKQADNFCPNCGKELVYVCASCFEKIEDMGATVRFCKECESKRAEKKEKIKTGVDTAKKFASKGAAVAPTVVKFAKDPKVIDTGKKVVSKLIKK